MGVVHHSAYAIYFEQGRTDFLGEFVMPYDAMEREGALAAVLSYTVEIKRDFRYGQTGILKTYPEWFEGVRMKIRYEMTRQHDDILVATGSTLLAFLSPELRPVNPRHFSFYPQLKEVFDGA